MYVVLTLGLSVKSDFRALVAEVMSERISELFKFGLENVWMKNTIDEEDHVSNDFEAATVLGYDGKMWDAMGYGSGFLTKKKYMNFTCMRKMLARTCEIQTREWNNLYNNAHHHETWFRFVPISNSMCWVLSM
jgi:hypothetical protein